MTIDPPAESCRGAMDAYSGAEELREASVERGFLELVEKARTDDRKMKLKKPSPEDVGRAPSRIPGEDGAITAAPVKKLLS
jgi:hypothetical protein